jgi:carbamate kinase
MGPKAEAARRFVERGGEFAAIASLEKAVAALEGTAGTIVREPRESRLPQRASPRR